MCSCPKGGDCSTLNFDTNHRQTTAMVFILLLSGLLFVVVVVIQNVPQCDKAHQVIIHVPPVVGQTSMTSHPGYNKIVCVNSTSGNG